MNSVLIVSLITASLASSPMARACEHHKHEAMKAASELPGGSLYQLDSKWKDQAGREQKLSEFKGQVRLVAMVFTRCKTACPIIVQQIKEIERQVSSDKIHVDLFSFDSKRETVESLKHFADEYKFDESRWGVHASTTSAVSELAGALGVQYKQLASGDFIHSNIIFLLNEKGEVIAKQTGLGKDDKEFVNAIRKSISAQKS